MTSSLNIKSGVNLKPNVNLYSDLGRDLLLNLDPLIYTDGYGGITYGAQAEQVVFTSWTKTNVTNTVSGDGYVITNTTDTGNHNTYLNPALQPTRVAGPYLFQADFKKGLLSEIDTIMIEIYNGLQLKVNLTTGASSFLQQTILETSYPVGDGYLTNLGDGWYRVILRSNNISVAFNTPAIYMYDATGKNLSWNGLGVDGRILVRNIITEQKCVLYWTDLRNGRSWEAVANRQPIYWTDGYGPCLVFQGNQEMRCNSIAPLANGEDIPIWVAGAVDNIATITNTYLWTITNSALTQLHCGLPRYNTSAIYTTYRTDAVTSRMSNIAGGLTVTGGAFIDAFNGVNRTAKFGTAAAINQDQSAVGSISFNILAIGGRGGGPYCYCRLREFAFSIGKSIPNEIAYKIQSDLTKKYGY
jgi:hypothetical protein